jgi:hypothetical protein
VYGANRADGSLKDNPAYFCYERVDPNIEPEYDFGGFWGNGTNQQFGNPLANDQLKCPDGFGASTVLFQSGVDYRLTVCWRHHSKGRPGIAHFGGMFGTGLDTSGNEIFYFNPLTGGNTCPSGYRSTQVREQSSTDSRLNYCWQPI